MRQDEQAREKQTEQQTSKNAEAVGRSRNRQSVPLMVLVSAVRNVHLERTRQANSVRCSSEVCHRQKRGPFAQVATAVRDEHFDVPLPSTDPF